MAQVCVLILIKKSIVLIIVRYFKFISYQKAPVRDASGLFSCCFLKIISKMFDGSREKCYLCRRNDDIELRLCAD